ncbi:MAG: hypothetical protein WCR20_19955 [Verrucomicrobiota bacterium]
MSTLRTPATPQRSAPQPAAAAPERVPNRIPEWRQAGLTLDITMPRAPLDVSIHIWDQRTGNTFVAVERHPDLEACLLHLTPKVISYLSHRDDK